VAWCSFLAAFRFETVRPISPKLVLGVEKLFQAVKLARRDVFEVLLGIFGQFTVLEVASCLFGCFLFTSVESTKMIRKFICLARFESLHTGKSMVHLLAIAGSFSGQPLVSILLVAWCSFLAAFCVEAEQPICPEHVLEVEQLFAAMRLAC